MFRMCRWCVTVCVSKPCETHHRISGDLTSPLNNNLIHPEQLGVAYFGLLGVLQAPQENALVGLLHIFVKAVHTEDNGHQLRGFAYHDASADLLLWADLKLGTPSQLTTWVPRLTVSSTVPGAPNITLQSHPAISDGRPFTFEGHVPRLESIHHTYQLHVDHWPRHASLTRALRVAHPPASASTAPQVFTIVGQLYGLPSRVCGLQQLCFSAQHLLFDFTVFLSLFFLDRCACCPHSWLLD